MASQEFLAFLADSRARLLAVVEGAAPELLTRRPAPERWSALEVVEHLALTEPWFLQVASDLAEDGRRKGLWYNEGQPRSTDSVAALMQQIDVRQPLVAMESVRPTGSVALPDLLERLGRSRQGLLDLLPVLDELDTDQLRFRHPTAGFELTAYEWVHLAGAHERQHTRQIRKALEAVSGS